MPKKQKEKSSIVNSIIKGHLYLLIILLPLVFWLDTSTIFALPKLLVLRTLSLSAGFFILLDIFLQKKIELKVPKHSIFLGLWLISLILSTVFSLNQFTSLFGQYGRYMGFFTFFNFLLIPFYIASYFNKQDLKDMISLSVATSVFVALFGLLQYFNFFGMWQLPFSWTDSPQNRVFATMGHANHLGAYLAAHFLMLAYSISFKNFKKKAWLIALQIASLLLVAYIILLTASRGAVLALILSALVIYGLRVKKYWGIIRTSTSKIMAAVIAIVFLVVVSGNFIVENIREVSIVKRTEQTIAAAEKGFIPDRLSFLYSSWEMFLDHPLTGTGLSTFRDAYSAYRRTDYQIDGPGNVQYFTVPESAHNEYANTLATQGIIGLISFLMLLIVSIGVVTAAYFKAPHKNENWHLVLLGGILVFGFQTIFNFGEIVNWFLFFLLIGIIFAEQKQPREINLKVPLLTSVLMVLFFTAIFAIGIRDGVLSEWQADYYQRQAKEAWIEGDIVQANNFYQVAAAAKPYEYQLHQAHADFALEISYAQETSEESVKYLQQSINSYRKASETNSHYPSTYHNMALAYLQLYRLTDNLYFATQSMENYQLSVEKAPNNPRYLYEFARKLHSDWDDRVKAVKLLKKALEIAPDYQEPQDYLDFLYKNHPELKSI